MCVCMDWGCICANWDDSKRRGYLGVCLLEAVGMKYDCKGEVDITEGGWRRCSLVATRLEKMLECVGAMERSNDGEDNELRAGSWSSISEPSGKVECPPGRSTRLFENSNEKDRRNSNTVISDGWKGAEDKIKILEKQKTD